MEEITYFCVNMLAPYIMRYERSKPLSLSIRNRRGKKVNGARKEEDHQAKANAGTHCTQEKLTGRHVHASQSIPCAESI